MKDQDTHTQIERLNNQYNTPECGMYKVVIGEYGWIGKARNEQEALEEAMASMPRFYENMKELKK